MRAAIPQNYVALFLTAVVALAGCGTDQNLVATQEAKTKDAVLNSVLAYKEADSDYKDVNGRTSLLSQICEFTARYVVGADISQMTWNVYSNDPKQAIWAVECVAPTSRVTANGNANEITIILRVLYDKSTQRLYFEDSSWVDTLSQLGTKFQFDGELAYIPVPFQSP